MTFQFGDAVHVQGFGQGVIREVRNNGRYQVEVKGRRMVVDATMVTAASESRSPRQKVRSRPRAEPDARPSRADAATSLDLHGCTVEEAIDALDAFVSEGILADLQELRVIHGRSGGRIKAAVHRRLGELPTVRSFRVDPINPGVTIVAL